MAKRRRKINMAQAIRDYLAKNPSAMPKDIQAALAAASLVSMSICQATR